MRKCKSACDSSSLELEPLLICAPAMLSPVDNAYFSLALILCWTSVDSSHALRTFLAIHLSNQLLITRLCVAVAIVGFRLCILTSDA